MDYKPLDPGHTPLPAEVRGLFPHDVALALCDPRQPLVGLLGQERNSLGPMADRRQREFTAGRFAARRAMRELGVPPQPVLPGEDRAPIWPPGLIGSLSHSETLCICVLGHTRDVLSLGVDVEENTDLDGDLVETICTPEECTWLYRHPDEARGPLAKLLFSAKETAYKAQYPLSREVLGYHDIAIEPDLPRGRFWARFTRDIGPFRESEEIEGRFYRGAELIVTAVCLRPEAAATDP